MVSIDQTNTGPVDIQVCDTFHRAIELIGRRWSGAIISVMLKGATRFCELRAAIPGISDRLLTERLRELEDAGIRCPARRGHPPTAGHLSIDAEGTGARPRA